MGASDFFTKSFGKTPQEAFRNAQEDASHEYGHGGYTGSIAEKNSFIMISLPENKNPMEYALHLIETEDNRIDDKWGPAGCIKIKDGEYLFFGWASS